MPPDLNQGPSQLFPAPETLPDRMDLTRCHRCCFCLPDSRSRLLHTFHLSLCISLSCQLLLFYLHLYFDLYQGATFLLPFCVRSSPDIASNYVALHLVALPHLA